MAVVREFNGERFYLKSGGHFRNPHSAIHRRVWEANNGQIPHGMVIHHIDHDPSNNEIENLALMERGEHTSLHVSAPGNLPNLIKKMDIARKIGNIIDVPCTCEQCGKQTLAARKAINRRDARRKRFCSKKCASRADYLRRKAKDNIL